nr:hypothetical protein [Nanoarchaeum sp.]
MGCNRIKNSSSELEKYLLFFLLGLVLFSVNVCAEDDESEEKSLLLQTTPLQFLPYNFDVGNTNAEFDNDAKLQNDLFSGGFSIYYPFEVPPGINDFQPNIFLMYNSHSIQNKQGVMDAGWSFSESYLQRDTNFTNNNTNDDTFILTLDGTSIELVNNSGTFHTKYEWFYDIDFFDSAGNNTNGNYWLIKDKSGNSFRFGYNDNSEIISNPYNYTWRWNLDQRTDTYNNSIYYTYIKPNQTNVDLFYLDKVEYSNLTKKILFDYMQYNDSEINYQFVHGKKISMPLLLNQVSTLESNNLVKRYVINYISNGYDSKYFVSNITVYGNDNTSVLPPTKFSYNYVDKGFQEISSSIFPFTLISSAGNNNGYEFGDVNGDGLEDVLWGQYDTNCQSDDVEAWLNNGSGFIQNNTFVSPLCFVNENGQDLGVRLIDINNDGFADILYGYSDERRAYINNGSGFVRNDSLAPPARIVTSSQLDSGLRFAELNGDGFPDALFGLYDDNCVGSDMKAWINTGNGFVENSNFAPPGCFVNGNGIDRGYRVIDLNADGLSDVIFGQQDSNCEAISDRNAWINNGTAFVQDSNWIPPICFAHIDGYSWGYQFMDIDMDGYVDILKGQADSDCSGYDKDAYINNGSGFVEDYNWAPPECFFNINSPVDYGVRFMDLNKDNVIDIIKSREGTKSVYSNKNEEFLLINYTNSIGGVTKIGYKPAGYYNNTGNDGKSDLSINPFVVSNVSYVHFNNKTFVNYYNYSGGYYEHQLPDSGFRGFSFAEETRFDGTNVKHWFNQSKYLTGKEYLTEVYDKNKNLVQKTENSWSYSDNGGYYVNQLRSSSEINYYENSSISKNTSFTYDNYSNILTVDNFGDVNLERDEKFERFEYVYNTTSWIIDKVKKHSVYAEDNSTLVSETKYNYDGKNYGDVPSKGDVTQVESYLNTGSNPIVKYSYDSFGNIINQTDANENSVFYYYDSTNTVINRIVNPKQQTERYDYNLGTGKLNWKIDSNAVVSNYTYDIFGRIQKEILFGDSLDYSTKQYTYEFDGLAPEMIKIESRINSGDSDTISQVYAYDNFGNIIQTRTEAENDKEIVQDVEYNGLNKVANISNKYYTEYTGNFTSFNNSVPKTYYDYDHFGRIKKIINPNESETIILYKLLNTTIIDENNNSVKYIYDAYDRIIEVNEGGFAEKINITNTTDMEISNYGLVSYWSFDNDTVDSISGHNGTINGATHYSNCSVNGCYYFGSEDYIRVNHHSDYQKQNITIMFFVRLNSYQTSTRNIIFKDISGDQSGAYKTQYTSSNHNTNPNDFLMSSDPNDYIYYSEFDKNQWYFVTSRIEPLGFDFFVNDNYVLGSGENHNWVDNSYNLIIGNSYNYDTNLDGYIDELSIWNRSLNSTEIDWIYNNIGLCDIDEGTCFFDNKTDPYLVF